MLSDITSDQHDTTQCRHCGVTLATCLLSCPSCGANQLDPLGWYSPSTASASVRLPPPASTIAPQLAAPAAWHTPAGVEDDRFHAKYDPWHVPKRSPFVWVIAGLAVVFVVVAIAAYFALRPSVPVISVAPKAVSGTVMAQQAVPVPRAVVSAPGGASSVVSMQAAPAPSAAKPFAPEPLAAKPSVPPPLAEKAAPPAPLAAKPPAPAPLVAKAAPPAPLAAKPVAPTTLAAKPAAPAPLTAKLPEAEIAVPKAAAPKPVLQLSTAQPAAVPNRSPQASVVPAPAAQTHAASVVTAQSSTASRPIAQTPSSVSKPATQIAATAPRSSNAPKSPQATLAAVPHPATPPSLDAKHATTAKSNAIPYQTRPDIARNLQIASAMLQKDNLTSAETHLSAVLAAQPKNREALDMREDLSGREQQRDAALDVARGCVYMTRWNCAWQNAGNALVIDSGSVEAKAIIAQAMNEAQPPTKPSTSARAIQAHEPPDHH
jgi:hypothetical protein